MVFPFHTETPLVGVLPKRNIDTHSVVAWLDGKNQQEIDQYVAEHFGFRTTMIRADNQISYSVFREVSPQSSTRIVRGIDDYLFEKGYIDSYNKRDVVSNAQIEQQVARIKQLQDDLQAQHKTFLLIISPSKASVMHEYIPERFVDIARTNEPTNYEMLVPLLEKYDINFFDAHAFAMNHKQTSPYPFFLKSGTHWSYYGACKVSEKIMEQLEKLSQKNVVNISCDPPSIDTTLQGTDKDLLELLNLLDPEAIVEEAAIPYYQNNAQGDEFHPRVLAIGDSFMWTPLAILESQNVFAYRDFYYYFNTNYTKDSDQIMQIDRQNYKTTEALKHDVILLEVNESGILDIGFGFVEAYLHGK